MKRHFWTNICLFQSSLPLTASCSGLSTTCRGHFQTARDVTSDRWSAPHSRALSQNAQTVIKNDSISGEGRQLVLCIYVWVDGLCFELNLLTITVKTLKKKKNSGRSSCTTSWFPVSSGLDILTDKASMNKRPMQGVQEGTLTSLESPHSCHVSCFTLTSCKPLLKCNNRYSLTGRTHI